jgi:predicted O-methyltransferase YrrM
VVSLSFSSLVFQMPKRSLLPDAIERYATVEMRHEAPVLRELRAETATLPRGGMQIGADQGAFMAILVRLIHARRCLEIGTFTGYSALVVAMALPSDGRLVACDVSDEWTRIARRYWAKAGVAERIDLRLGPARDTLAGLIRDGAAGSFDFAFIDADKTGYDAYYDACMTLVRPGGLILLDNALQDGAVVDPAAHDADTDAIRAINSRVRDDKRVDAVLLTIGDGVVLAWKKEDPTPTRIGQ